MRTEQNPRGSLWDSRWEFLPVAIYACDARGRILGFSRRAADLWGRSPAINSGADLFCGSHALFHADGMPMARDQAPMADVLRTGVPVRGMQAVFERPNGSRVVCALHIDPAHDASGRRIGAVNCFFDVTDSADSKSSDRRLELMASEVDHRAKNILAVVQATIRLTRGATVDDFRAVLRGRIDALARAHTLLAGNRWQGANLGRLAEAELAPFRLEAEGRVRARGPSVLLHAAAAQSLAMALHELAANAARYGALSVPGGRLRVVWAARAGETIGLRWKETGGPSVRKPERKGVGTTIIERMIQQHGGTACFDWRTEGLVCDVAFPLAKVAPKAAAEVAALR